MWRGGGSESSNEEKRELQQELTCLQDRRAVTHKHSARSLSLLGGGKRFAREVSGQAVTATADTPSRVKRSVSRLRCLHSGLSRMDRPVVTGTGFGV